MADLTALIERLEAATGPDRELDATIASVVEPHRFDAPGFTPIRPIPPFRYSPSEGAIRFEGGGIMCMTYFPAFTASIDAAVDLAERVLPSHGRMGSKGRVTEDEPMYAWQIFAADLMPKPCDPISEAEHSHDAIALCLAILRALSAQEDGK